MRRISVVCRQCGAQHAVPEKHLGKKFSCTCGERITAVPSGTQGQVAELTPSALGGSGLASDNAELSPAERYCPRCGSTVAWDAQFCGVCGESHGGSSLPPAGSPLGGVASPAGMPTADMPALPPPSNVAWYQWWGICVFNKYAVGQGRARRKEYWYFVLVNTLINFAITFVLAFVEEFFGLFPQTPEYVLANLGSGVLSLLLLIPTCCVQTRRLHDVGKSGWMQLVLLIPIIGAFWLLFLMVRDSDPGPNQYGPNPKFIRA